MSRAKSPAAKKKAAPAAVPETLVAEESKKKPAAEAKASKVPKASEPAASPAKPTKKRAAPSKPETKAPPAPVPTAEAAPSPAKKQKPAAKAAKPKAEPIAADSSDASPAQPRKRKQPSKAAEPAASEAPEAQPASPAPTKKAKQKAKSPAPKRQPAKKAAAKEPEASADDDEPETNGDAEAEVKAPVKGKGAAAKGKGKKPAAAEPSKEAQVVADALFSTDNDSDSEFEGLEDEEDAGSKQVSLSESQLSDLESVAKALAAKGRKAESGKTAGRGVIYLGHIPHGFFEDQMRGFFTQFGTITRLRLSRSKKTGNSRGYAFIEFETPEVAEIVADTMNGYMMFGRSLKCHVVLPEQLHADTFKGANKKFRRVPWTRLAREQMNKTRTPEQQKKRVSRLQKKDNDRRAKLAELGIDYQFEGYTQAKPKPEEITEKAKSAKPATDAKPKAKPAKAKKTA